MATFKDLLQNVVHTIELMQKMIVTHGTHASQFSKKN